MESENTKLSQERLREIAWEIGATYPPALNADGIALYMVTPDRGHIHWHIRNDTLEAVKAQYGEALRHAALVVRVYDVTDILFDGLNAHSFFDIEVHALMGNHYFHVPKLARNYLAEIGLRGNDGTFRYLARSETVFFERARPSGNFSTTGLFVGGALKRTFQVENVFDASIYEAMNAQLQGIERQEPLSVAMVMLGIHENAGIQSPLGASIAQFPQKMEKLGGTIQLFAPMIAEDLSGGKDELLLDQIRTLSDTTYQQVKAAHQQTPFHFIHCHDWYSSQVGLMAARDIDLPVVLSLHSTEYERTQGYGPHELSSIICEWEKEAVQHADLVIVPHSSTRQQVISLYEASPEKVVIIPDVFMEQAGGGGFDASGARNWLSINPNVPVVLFAGEMSHAAGADLLMDALPSVCRAYGTAMFVFAGDGPLKGELEARAGHAGIGHRCRFVGDVSKETFEALLLASDFVVIPARTWQDEGLAQMAIGFGRPVLTTHQAGIHCISHGQNGLITYDNPGSIIWGVQELLANPLQGNMLRLVAKKKANESISLENVVAQHYLHYEILLKNVQGEKVQ